MSLSFSFVPDYFDLFIIRLFVSLPWFIGIFFLIFNFFINSRYISLHKKRPNQSVGSFLKLGASNELSSRTVGRGQPPLLLCVRDGLCRADLRTDEQSEIRIANRLSRQEHSSFGETLRAWSKYKTAKQLSIVLREGVFCANELRLKRFDKNCKSFV